jgi:hypothetical protein
MYITAVLQKADYNVKILEKNGEIRTVGMSFEQMSRKYKVESHASWAGAARVLTSAEWLKSPKSSKTSALKTGAFYIIGFPDEKKENM